MSMYTFYCSKPDGSAPTFHTYELASKKLARAKAEALLRDHETCSHIVVFEEDVESFTQERSVMPSAAHAIAPEAFVSKLSQGDSRDAADRLDVAVIATRGDGTVVYWNASAECLYGWASTEAVGRNVVELKASLQSRARAEEIMDTLRSGQSWKGDIVLRRRDGSPVVVFAADTAFGLEPETVIVGASATADRRRAVMNFLPVLLDDLRTGEPDARLQPSPGPQ